MSTKNKSISDQGRAWRATLRVVLQASYWLLVVAAILAGAIGAVVALLAAVAVTGSRTLAAIAGVLAVVLCTGGLSWLAVRGVSRSRRLRRWLPLLLQA